MEEKIQLVERLIKEDKITMKEALMLLDKVVEKEYIYIPSYPNYPYTYSGTVTTPLFTYTN